MIMFICMACSSRTELGDLEYRQSTGCMYLNGKAFTGEAWSSDGKTISITCNNGLVNMAVAYHVNGAKAIVTKSLFVECICYDETGCQITMDELIKYYPQLIEQIAAMTYEIKGL